jgi:predicted nuclease of predicted toxin-antitoxin system
MFLIDQNLSRRLVALLATDWPGCAHVAQEGLAEQSDLQIWEFARTSGRTILTKDRDFEALALTRGAPPKILIVAIGNSTTDQVLRLISAHAVALGAFLEGDEAVLVLNRP